MIIKVGPNKAEFTVAFEIVSGVEAFKLSFGRHYRKAYFMGPDALSEAREDLRSKGWL